ncbi:MAG: type II toxin-antitoxin system VapC family toxin [Actinobacteria bacterium]|nr:type II toxin-antitoxin system VapC family toxin [Actinomycetota bacterium]
MILLDANLLLYAYDSTSPVHGRARDWLEATLASEEEIGVALVSLLTFVRVGTNPSVFKQPLTVADAFEEVSAWLERPNVGMVQPTRRHFELLADLARTGKARGTLLMDAHLAALAIEHGATLCTTDRDFARFKGLRLEDPIAS